MLKHIPLVAAVAVMLAGVANAADTPPQPLLGAMTDLRRDHPADGIGGSRGGTAPLITTDGLVVDTAPPSPTLLVGVRDASGFTAYADAAEGVDLSPAATAMIGSQTKTFTAAAILQLDQEGKLSIKDSLADPKWAAALQWPNGEAITVEMLLSHTSGIPEFTASEQFQTAMSDPAWAPSPQDLLAFSRNRQPIFAPGTAWSYSNTGYIVLGVIIEQVTGNAYAAELRTRFFDRLGLTETHVYGDPPAEPTMPGYVLGCVQASGATTDHGAATSADGPPPCPSGKGEWNRIAAPADHIWSMIWSAGGVMSSTRDMTSWITRLVATDDVLDAGHRRLMQTSAPLSTDGIAKHFPSLANSISGYGLGLFVFSYDIGTGYGHIGNIPGYASSSIYFPGPGNGFAMTIVAGDTEADVPVNGGEAIATAIKALP